MNSTKSDPAGVQPVGNDLVLARSRKMQLIHEELARARMHEQREQVQREVLACEIAAARGHDVDKPRNLAKSVTVE